MRLAPRRFLLGLLVGIALCAPCAIGAAQTTRATLLGGTDRIGLRGLLRVVSADLQPPGFFVVGSSYEFYAAHNFLAIDDAKADHARMAASYSVAWTPWRFLAAAFAVHVVSDETTGAPRDELQVAVGDPELAIKTGFALGHGLHVGGLLDFRLPSAAGFFKLSGSALNTTVAALATWQGPQALPLRAHVNLGFHFDGSENLFDDLAALSPAQRFSAQVSSFHRVLARAGVEYLTRWVGPFLELSLQPFVGAGAPGLGDSPGSLTLGVRAWLGPRRGLQLLAAVDLGLTGVGDGAPSTLPAQRYAFAIPPWALTVGLSYRFDPWPAAPVHPRRPARDEASAIGARAPVEPARFALSGTVVADDSGEPVWDARISVEGAASSALAVAPKTGAFLTFPLPLGATTLRADAPGFEPLETEATVRANAPPLKLRLLRKATISLGTLRGIVSARGGAALAKATVLLPGIDRTLAVDARGQFSLELKPGEYEIVISAPRYRPQRKKLRVFEGSTVILNVELYR
ncbi:MAG: carboxypeptidase regulatory-like domain-containing protein [Proteobacteria bacterium]|nr:carboxypeptidase regulatory-like domain-containing protein [Pseudomonadota bacterium]